MRELNDMKTITVEFIDTKLLMEQKNDLLKVIDYIDKPYHDDKLNNREDILQSLDCILYLLDTILDNAGEY